MSHPSPTPSQQLPLSGHQFGTFGGVFTPSLLTILGVVMFMSAGLVIGEAGLWGALTILCLSNSITFLTSLSIAAISTNTPVKGGGAYFLISRSLGPEPGGAIGLTLFLAQALSVPFYVLGFTEALCVAFPNVSPHFNLITYATTAALFILNLVGASWAIRVQYFILATLALSIITFIGGGLERFTWENLQQNTHSAYGVTPGHSYDFWSIFAIYFPAVTGIMTGVNMSGDLRSPATSIPRGTLLAVGVSFAIYATELIVSAGAQTRQQLTHHFHETLLEQALFGARWLVVAGVFAATLSSALGSMLGAPRILQALARDDIFPPLSPFAQGRGSGDEPTRGLWLTFSLSLAVLAWAASARDAGDSGALNAVGSILTMFFLYAYGMTNIAAFAESFTRNPSFRPRFRYFHWLTALLGALGCLAVALLINWRAALLAVALILALFLYVQQRVLESSYGDVRRGFYYSRMRQNLLKLAAQPQHAKNWRPNTLILSGNPNTRYTLTQYAVWLEGRRGLATLVELMVGPLRDMLAQREEALRRLQGFIDQHRMEAFCEVLVTEDFKQGLSALLQCHAVGPLKPNLLVVGWPTQTARAEALHHLLTTASTLRVSAVVISDKGLPINHLRPRPRRVDIWWRGQQNGSLMLILAYLLCHNIEWSNHHVRVLRSLNAPDDRFADLAAEAEAEMAAMLDEARIKGEAVVVRQAGPFAHTLRAHSADATVVMIGLTPPRERAGEGALGAQGDEESPERFHERYAQLLAELPTTLLVYSAGHADLMS